MAYLIPETALRLGATAFVSDAEISAIGRENTIRAAARWQSAHWQPEPPK